MDLEFALRMGIGFIGGDLLFHEKIIINVDYFQLDSKGLIETIL